MKKKSFFSVGGGYLGFLVRKSEIRVKKSHFSPWEGGTPVSGSENTKFGVEKRSTRGSIGTGLQKSRFSPWRGGTSGFSISNVKSGSEGVGRSILGSGRHFREKKVIFLRGRGVPPIWGSKIRKKSHFSPWEGGTSGFGVQNVAFGVMVPDCGRSDPQTGPPGRLLYKNRRIAAECFRPFFKTLGAEIFFLFLRS